MKYGIKPVGTIAHEWIMAIAAKHDYKDPNGRAMDLWESGRVVMHVLSLPTTHDSDHKVPTVYPSSPTSPLHTMLTDTYAVKVFFEEFASSPARALRWNGLRHDSGDPLKFAEMAREAWLAVGAETIPPFPGNTKDRLKGRRVVFSDGLDVDEALRIAKACEEIGIDCGSWETMSRRGSRPSS
jgi:nicotinate phosphoribosyltransferase